MPTKLWSWPLVALLVWFAGAWFIVLFFGELMLYLSPVVKVVTPGLLLLIVFTASAHDARAQAGEDQERSTSG